MYVYVSRKQSMHRQTDIKNFAWEVLSNKAFFIQGRPYKPHCSIFSGYRTTKCYITIKYSISGSYRTFLALGSVPG